MESQLLAAPKQYGAQSMIGQLEWVLVHRPSTEYTEQLWRAYGLDGVPDLRKAQAQHDRLVSILCEAGAQVEYLEEHTSIQTSATYDPALITNEGAIILQSGRPERRVEMTAMARKLAELEIPIIGWLRGDGFMDAGDTLWLDHETLLVACGYRTNLEGIRQLRHVLDGIVREVIVFDNPHYEGPGYVIHLMSYVSLVSDDLAVTHSPLMPVRLQQLLRGRGYRFVEVPSEEFRNEACNILCLAPNRVVMVAGNPTTAARLRAEHVDVTEFDGDEICVKRKSGPTCNTRPLRRAL